MFAHTNSLTSMYGKNVRDSGRKLLSRKQDALNVIHNYDGQWTSY